MTACEPGVIEFIKGENEKIVPLLFGIVTPHLSFHITHHLKMSNLHKKVDLSLNLLKL